MSLKKKIKPDKYRDHSFVNLNVFFLEQVKEILTSYLRKKY